jgi:hypothetical protein
MQNENVMMVNWRRGVARSVFRRGAFFRFAQARQLADNGSYTSPPGVHATDGSQGRRPANG